MLGELEAALQARGQGGVDLQEAHGNGVVFGEVGQQVEDLCAQLGLEGLLVEELHLGPQPEEGLPRLVLLLLELNPVAGQVQQGDERGHCFLEVAGVHAGRLNEGVGVGSVLCVV